MVEVLVEPRLPPWVVPVGGRNVGGEGHNGGCAPDGGGRYEEGACYGPQRHGGGRVLGLWF